LIHALLNGDIVPVAKEKQLTMVGNLLLDANQVRDWLNSHRGKLTTNMSVDHASKILGVKQQVAYDLVRSRVLNAIDDEILGKRISPQDIQNFQENYVALAELARLQNCSPRKILKEMISRPVCGPTIDGTRQYFFRRSDTATAKSF
jgi:hypothetical protein